MGNQLDQAIPEHSRRIRHGERVVAVGAVPRRIDPETAALLKATMMALRCEPEIYALILFGSVARNEERPVTDSEPSDVDVLVLIDSTSGTGRLPLSRDVELRILIGAVSDQYRHAQREVQFTFARHDLAGWDPLFIENVARDGILLWARGPLPEPFAPIAERAAAGIQEAPSAT